MVLKPLLFGMIYVISISWMLLENECHFRSNNKVRVRYLFLHDKSNSADKDEEIHIES